MIELIFYFESPLEDALNDDPEEQRNGFPKLVSVNVGSLTQHRQITTNSNSSFD